MAPAVWGTTYLVTTELLPEGRPLLAGALRALPAGLLLLLLTRRLPSGGWWWRAAVLGALNIGLFFALLFVAAYRLPGGVAATLGAVQPLLVAGLGSLLLGQRVRAGTVVAGIAGVAGVALLVLRATAQLDAVGVVAGLGGAAAMALGVVLTARWGRPVPLLAFTGWQLTAGGLLLVPVVLLVEGVPRELDGAALGGIVYLGLVGTALAYALWFRGVQRLPAARVSFLGLLSPVVAAVLGWLVLDQALNGWQLAGAGLALAALVVAQRSGSPRSGAPRSGAPRSGAPGAGGRRAGR
ncbi:EamA family transporter [Cellulomonas endometrii]|uniref:EamA family transporter n=1 Tax=Cellulomonas endometrii TaxID=3036301 RepID=UPI0024AE679F|nr:EamA family transporter [Cellulomonas endometrii]